jgi:hypothetical protein
LLTVITAKNQPNACESVIGCLSCITDPDVCDKCDKDRNFDPVQEGQCPCPENNWLNIAKDECM